MLDTENSYSGGQPLSRLSFERPIPQAVRDNGWAIDPKILEPGDLILVSLDKPTWASRNIIKYQSMMFPEEHSKWHHAAVSGGRYEICEAGITGVRACEYWRYMTGEYQIKVRRLKGADKAERYMIAYYAAINVKTSYGFLAALNIANFMRKGESWRRPIIASRGIICSQLYCEASMRLGYLIVNNPPGTVCPADLSMSPLLEDVSLSWVEV
ncbi:MAG: hypothetical protein AAF543_09630 [Pseudomonadota bacterium]